MLFPTTSRVCSPLPAKPVGLHHISSAGTCRVLFQPLLDHHLSSGSDPRGQRSFWATLFTPMEHPCPLPNVQQMKFSECPSRHPPFPMNFLPQGLMLSPVPGWIPRSSPPRPEGTLPLQQPVGRLPVLHLLEATPRSPLLPRFGLGGNPAGPPASHAHLLGGSYHLPGRRHSSLQTSSLSTLSKDASARARDSPLPSAAISTHSGVPPWCHPEDPVGHQVKRPG